MKKATQWIFGMLFVAGLLLPMQCCYAYEGESEEDWVNRMWYNTQWTIARAEGNSDLIGRTMTFAQFLHDWTSYSDVMPWMESGRIHGVLGTGKKATNIYIEILAGGQAALYDEEAGYAGFQWLNMAARSDLKNRQ